MPKPQIVAPYMYVVMDDGAELEVQSSNWDMLIFERHARAHKWAPATEGAVEAMTFLAWHALKREAQIPPDMTYEQWAPHTLSIRSKVIRQDPTQQEAEEGS